MAQQELWGRCEGDIGEIWGRYEGDIGEIWGRYRAVGPAGSAVLGDVLVAAHGEVVHAVLVAPAECLRAQVGLGVGLGMGLGVGLGEVRGEGCEGGVGHA